MRLVCVTMAVIVTMAVTFTMILIMIVIMFAIVVVWRRRRQRLPGRDCSQRRIHVGLTGGQYLDALTSHALHKAGAGAAGHDGIQSEPVQRMIVTMVVVQRHAFGEIESLYLDGFLAGRYIKDDEAAALAGMAGDGAEVLAGNCDAHGLVS
jgi:hypothetical protein